MECSPQGRSRPKAAVCVREKIKSYPTWFIKGKRYEQVIEPDRLATLSGYETDK